MKPALLFLGRSFFLLFLLFSSGASLWPQNTAPIVGGVGSIVKANLVINALLSKDYTTVTHLFKDEKALLYTPNENGITPIALSIKNDDTFMLKYLLKQGVPLTSPYYTTPPLVLAMYGDALDSLKILLDSGADTQISYNNLTLLQMAVVLNRADLCKILLRYGAPVDQSSDKEQLSPLFMALIKGNWELASLLAKVSTNLNLADRKGQTPLGFFISSRPSDIPKYLDILGSRAKEVVNFATKSSPSPLFLAVDRHDTKTAQILLDAGANVNATFGTSRETPLMRAVKNSDEDMVRLFLEYDVNVKAKDRRGRSALSLAKGKEGILEILQPTT